LVYFFGAVLVIAGVLVLLSQLGVLEAVLNTLNISGVVLVALILIVVGVVLIRGASLISYGPNHEQRDRTELDYKDFTYEDQDSSDFGRRY
jgi:dipeptide/tripeptide permease